MGNRTTVPDKRWNGSARRWTLEDRKQAEEDLLRTNRPILDALDSVQELFFAVDEQWRITYLNRRLADLAGDERDRLVHQELWTVLPTAARNIGEQLREVMVSGKSAQFETYDVAFGGWIEVFANRTAEGLTAHAINISERKAVQSALEQSEERFRRIVETAAEGIWTIDMTGVTTFMNDRMARLLGSTPDEMQGRWAFDMVWPDDRAEALRQFEVTKEGAKGPYDIRLQRKDGTPVWVSVSAGLLRDREGKAVGGLAMMTDITERRLSEEALRDSNDTLAMVLHAGGLGGWQLDLRDGRLRLGENTAAILGAPPESSTWDDWLATIDPEDRELIRRTLRSTTPGERVTKIDVAYRRASRFGEARWIGLRGEVYAEDGIAIRAAGVCADTSERRRTEEMARRLAAIVESSEDAIIGKDLNGIITSWNRSAERMYGYSAEEAIGQSIQILSVPGRDDEMPQMLERIRHGEHIEHHETVRRTKSGRQIAVSLSISPIRDTRGAIVGASKIARDITDRKRAELELRDANRSLLRANENLKQFAYVAAHDLKEPLRMVSLYSQMLASRYRGRLDEQADMYLRFAQEGAQRMEELVNGLLLFTRSADALDDPLEAVNCTEVLKTAQENLAAAVMESGAEISVEPLPAVRAHTIPLTQLFQNLLANAIKYRQPGTKPRIHVGAEQRPHDWLFRVEDNGIGIEPRYHEQIFGVFKRLHRDRYPGTGIGLALCARVVERYRGAIWVESELGKGATFFFTIAKAGDPDSDSAS